MLIKDILIRIGLAILIGGAIGYEREFRNRPAGFRTHMLVCIGATIVSLIQLHMGNDVLNIVRNDPRLANVIKVDCARLGAQVISGVGFLGAGTILHNKGSIKGLTTAASLWVVACVGLAIGCGYYYISIFGGLSVVLVLGTLKKFQNKFIIQSGIRKIEICYINKKTPMDFIERCFAMKSIKIRNIEFDFDCEDEEFNNKIKRCLYTISVPKAIDVNEILNELTLCEDIVKVSEIKS